MAFATKDDLFGSASNREVVTLRNGLDVMVCEMSGHDRTAIDYIVVKGENGEANPKRELFRAMLVVACTCNECGDRMFAASDMDAVGKMPAGLIEPIVDAAIRVNGLSDKEVDVIEGNSETDQVSSSGSN